jgi:tetratricopeptide (TPR) repeat protein
MAHVLRHQGRYSAAHKYYNKALEIFTELSGRQTLSVAVCLKHLGIVSCLLGFYEEARTRLEEA